MPALVTSTAVTARDLAAVNLWTAAVVRLATAACEPWPTGETLSRLPRCLSALRSGHYATDAHRILAEAPQHDVTSEVGMAALVCGDPLEVRRASAVPAELARSSIADADAPSLSQPSR